MRVLDHSCGCRTTVVPVLLAQDRECRLGTTFRAKDHFFEGHGPLTWGKAHLGPPNVRSGPFLWAEDHFIPTSSSSSSSSSSSPCRVRHKGMYLLYIYLFVAIVHILIILTVGVVGQNENDRVRCTEGKHDDRFSATSHLYACEVQRGDSRAEYDSGNPMEPKLCTFFNAISNHHLLLLKTTLLSKQHSKH